MDQQLRRRQRNGSTQPQTHHDRPHRRTHPRDRRIVSAAYASARACVETLEGRRLLTTISGGGMSNGVPVAESFEYLMADDSIVRVTLGGNITVELIGLQVHPGDDTLQIPAGQQELVDMREPPPQGSQLPDGQVGTDIFKIYIASADADAYIAIAEVPALTTTPRPMQPFGGARTVRVQNIGPDGDPFITAALPNTVGGVYIGAQTVDTVDGTTDDEDTALLSFPLTTDYGVMPAPADGRIVAGIESAPGVSIGRIYIGGVVTGRVNLGGSIQQFYAGAILTGDANGQGRFSAPRANDNFLVNGDAHQIIAQVIGTDTLNADDPLGERQFNAGTDIRVTGKIGQVLSLNDFYAAVRAENTRPASELQIHIREIEQRVTARTGSSTLFQGTNTGFGFLHSIGAQSMLGALNNDTFATPQYVHTYFDSGLNENQVAVIDGFINGGINVDDFNDYYGLPLIAGQKVTVDLDGFIDAERTLPADGVLAVGVFDPDGRLIATDRAHPTGRSGGSLNAPFQFVADRPGTYRIVIGGASDEEFDGTPQLQRPFGRVSAQYTLTLRGAGDLAVGAVSARDTLLVDQFRVDDVNGGQTPYKIDSISVISGDLGAIAAGESVVWASESRFFVERGNLREIIGESIGYRFNNGLSGAPHLHVRKGVVGHVRSTGNTDTSDVLLLNTQDADPSTSAIDRTQAVGVDYQVVDSATDLWVNLIAKRGINVIRTDSLGAVVAGLAMPASYLVANSDGVDSDGVIGLIDVSGNVGSIGVGGPAIDAGSGGNVRYFDVDGVVFKDRFFGTGGPERVTAQPNQVVTLTDDSGTDFTLTPIQTVAGGSGFGTPTNGSGFQTVGTISYTAYPVRAGTGARAGVVMVNVTSTTGLRVTSQPRSENARVDIARIEVQGVGRPINVTPSTTGGAPTYRLGPGGVELALDLRGSVPVNVYAVRHPDAAGAGQFTSVVNSTAGELVNLDARSVGRLEANVLGVTPTQYGTALLQREGRVDPVLPTELRGFPFRDQRNSININGGSPGTFRELNGNVISILARQSLGNIIIDGNVGLIQANSDGKNTAGVFEGITAPILGFGELTRVLIGEGLPPSGTGLAAQSGLYAEGLIRRVENQGAGSDVRGDIVSNTQIGEIVLRDGAIINNDIGVLGEFIDTAEIGGAFVVADTTVDTLDNPVFEIQRISLTGIGGIIGSYIRAADVGPITVSGGFGMVETTIQAGPNSTIDSIVVDGYGIRSSTFDGGGRIRNINARGDGTRLSTNTWTSSVRLSTNNSFDPFFLTPPNSQTDLHTFLGTTQTSPRRKGVSNSGIIADSEFIASRDLGSMTAYQIQARNPFDASGTQIPFNSPLFPMRLSFGNKIGTLRTGSDVIGVSVSSGGIDTANIGGAVDRSSFGISGRVTNFTTRGTFKGNSSLIIGGPDGALVNLNVRGSLFAQVNVALGISSAIIGKDVGSRSFLASRSIDSLDIGGNVLAGALIRSRRTIVKMVIDGDVQAGATIQAKVISQQQIGGNVFGSIIVGL